MSDTKTPKLELAQMIKALRAELAKAEDDGKGKDIRFTVEDVELELQIATEGLVEGGIGAKFYVFTSQLKGSEKNVVTQKMKIKLRPIAPGGGPVNVSDSDKISFR